MDALLVSACLDPFLGLGCCTFFEWSDSSPNPGGALLMCSLSIGTTDLHQWIDRIQQGDHQAENELCDHFHRRLECLSREMLGHFPQVGHQHEASDLLQDVVMKRLLPYLRTNRPSSVAHFFNVAAQQMRWELLTLAKNVRDPKAEAIEISLQDAEDPRAEKELTQWVILHEAVEQLSERLQTVVDLLIYHGLSKKEAAQALGVSEREVRRRWASACATLYEALDGELPTA